MVPAGEDTQEAQQMS
jgi:hypothetical protein